MIHFEPISIKHLQYIREIYNEYVKTTTVSFDLEPATIEKITKLTMHDEKRFCSFVIKEDNEVIGYVLLSPFIQKHACFRTAEVTIYLDVRYGRRGIGSRALEFIEEQARANGFHTLIAVICTENESSIAAFSAKEYQLKGIISQVAYKFDRHLDVCYYQKLLL
ncbi:GNAT family N-acetyltransferase [Paenibacillus endoradicis]|uniref:GNAT family N-acetyltransferase n=1 Tax=Paenibacillus endoradicis TaxID=2972487 RepID=UPI0021593279|nr:GNAT family N-acetyltransferase [Paenibacillus endoradicis]MCR8657831.1 GNAT family N-acetyltransferase [Paenibacillus endoradicis]